MSTVSKTCQSCASSKVRCMRNTDNPHVCNRCRRLGKECLYRQTGRRFHGFQKDRRIEALESKVKELMSDRATSSGEVSGDPSETSTRCELVAEHNGGGHEKIKEDVVTQGFLNMEMAESYVTAFKSVMTPHFPFVVIGSDVTATQLRKERPFLFLTVLASAAYENMPLQRSLGSEVKKAVAARMIVHGEISFDMLQGLLVYLAWSHYYTKPHRFTQFLQLAVSLVIELRLDRPPTTESWKTSLRFAPQDNPNEQAYTRPSWGNDEKRAVLGCYYLSSMAVLLQKHPALPHVPYFDDCSQSLSRLGEYHHDRHFGHILQLQHLLGKIDRISASNYPELLTPGSGAELYVQGLQSDLQAFRSQFDSKLSDIPFLAFYFHATELCLYQLALNLVNKAHSPQPVSFQSWQKDMSCAALDAAQSMLSLYLSLPTASELGFTDMQWVQMGFAMLVAWRVTVKLSNTEQTAAFLRLLTQVRQRVGSLSTPRVDLNGDRDVFFDFRRRIAHIQGRMKGNDVPEATLRSGNPMNEHVLGANPETMGAELSGDPEPITLPLNPFATMTGDNCFPHGYLFDAFDNILNTFDAFLGSTMETWQ